MGTVAHVQVRVSCALTDFEKDLKSVQGQFNRMGGTLQSAGSAMTKALTLPIAGFVAASVSAGLKFEAAMNQIQGVMSPTARQMDDLRAKALKMGADTVFSATDAATAMLELGKAGFNVQDSLDSVADVMQLAAASGLSMSEAAEMSARTMNAFGLQTKDLAHINDVLAAAVNGSSLEIRDLQVAFNYVGGVARGFGISIEQASAALGIMRDRGIEAETAGRALREGLGRLANPVKSVTKVMQELGISTFKTADGSLMNLSQVIGILHDKGLTAAQSLQMFGDSAGPGMYQLVSAGAGALDTFTDELMHSDGAAKKMADSMMQGLPGAFEQLRGSLETAGIAISKALEPVLVPVLNGLTAMVNVVATGLVPAFQALPTPIQAGVIGFVGLAAAIGPVTYAAGAATRAVAGMISTLRTAGIVEFAGELLQLAKAQKEVAAAQQAFNFAGVLTNSKQFTDILGGMGAAGKAAAAGGLLRTANQEASQFMIAGMSGIAKAEAEVVTNTSLLSKALTFLGSPLSSLKGLALGLMTPVVQVVMSFTTWSGAAAALASGLEAATGPIGWTIAGITALGVAVYNLAGGWDGIKAGISGTLSFLHDLGTIVYYLASEAFTSFESAVSGAWQAFKGGFVDGLASAGHEIASIGTSVLDFAQQFVDIRGALSTAGGWWDSFVSGAKDAYAWVKETAAMLRSIEAAKDQADKNYERDKASGAIGSVSDPLASSRVAASTLAENYMSGLVDPFAGTPFASGIKKPSTAPGAPTAAQQMAKADQNFLDDLLGKKDLHQAQLLANSSLAKGLTGLNSFDLAHALDSMDMDKRVRIYEIMHDAIKQIGADAPDSMKRLEAATLGAATAAGKAGSKIEITSDFLRDLNDSFNPLGATERLIEFQNGFSEATTKADRLNESIIDTSALSGTVVDQFGNVSESAHDVAAKYLEVADGISKAEQKSGELTKQQKAVIEGLHSIGSALGTLGQSIGGSAGSFISGIGGIVSALGTLKEQAGKTFTTMDTLSAGIQGAAAVYQGAKSGGVFGGALSGLEAGMNPALMAATGGWSAAIGFGAGVFMGAMNQGPSEESLQAARAAVLQFGDALQAQFNKLATFAQRMEAAGDASRQTTVLIRDAYRDLGRSDALADISLLHDAENRGDTAKVQQILDRINQRLQEHQQQLEDWASGVSQFNEGFAARVSGFADSMSDLSASTDDAAASFQRMGQYAVMAFAQTFAQTKSVSQAIEAVKDPLAKLTELQKQFGFEGSASYQKLQDISGIVNANADIFASLDGLNQMMQGLQTASLMTNADMQLFGQDAASLFAELTARGVDANTAMALMQPTLQSLWEHQQQFGAYTDAATEALVNQAATAGIVGAEQRDVMSQVLGVLVEMRDILSQLPELMRNAIGPAQELATAMGHAPGPDAVYTGGNAVARDGSTPNVPVFANEGVVSRPTLALIGDAPEPEMVLRRSTVAAIANGGGKGNLTVEVNIIGGTNIGTSQEFKRTVLQAVNEGLEQDGQAWGRHERIVKQMVRSS